MKLRYAAELGESHRSTAPTSSSAVRIALFVTCIGDTLFPEAGARDGRRSSSGSATRSSFPAEQTCCGQMHMNSGYRARGARAGRAASSRSFGRLRGGRLAVVVVRRRRCASSTGSCSGIEHPVLARACELSELLVRPARRRGRRRVVRAPRRLPPDLPLAAGDARRRRAAAAAAQRARARAGRAAAARRVLRLRRHVRGQERRHVERDAGRQVRRDRVDAAPRSAPRSTARACCRSAAGSRAAARPCAAVHLAEILAADESADESFPEAAARRARERPAARRTCATRPTRSAPSARGSSRELPDWEELREAGSAIKADVLAQPRRATCCSSRRR